MTPTSTELVGGRYRLLHRIGSGSMGVVWSGCDEVLHRRVAVKEVRHGWGSSDRTVAEGRERGLREARAAAALDHPGIVGVYDIVEHDDRPWIVMELVSGRFLKALVADEGPLPPARAVDIAVQLLSALEAAHRAGITHRDVKPANVLVAAGDRVRLTDFGLAVLPGAETLTESGVALGTPGYLPPEQPGGCRPARPPTCSASAPRCTTPSRAEGRSSGTATCRCWSRTPGTRSGRRSGRVSSLR